jgi:hypothetical protein
MRIVVALLFIGTVLAETKTEADLRVRLAASEAARIAAQKDKANLLAALAKLHSQGATQSVATEVNRDVAVNSADNAKVLAASVAAIQKEQMDKLQAVTDRGNTQVITIQAFGFLALLVTLLHKSWTDGREHRWAQEVTDKHRELVVTKLDTSISEAHAAYVEANTVNTKIADIGLQMRDGSKPKPQDE